MKSLGWIVAALLAVALLVSIGSQNPPVQPTAVAPPAPKQSLQEIYDHMMAEPSAPAGNAPLVPASGTDHTSAHDREMEVQAQQQTEALQQIANAQQAQANH